MLAAFATTILFSISAMCGYKSSKRIGGAEANFWRITLATVLLAIWAFTRGKGLSGVALPVFLLSGVVGIGLGDTAYFQTLPRLGPRLSLLVVQCLTAPFGALIEWVWLGTRLTPQQILCGVTILFGVGLALTPGKHLTLTRRDLTIGSVAGILAALGGAAGAVLSRKAYVIVHDHGESIDSVTAGFQRVLGGVFIVAFCWFVVKQRRARIGDNDAAANEESSRRRQGVWIWVVLNSLAGQTFGVTCLQRALETTPTGIVLSIIATSPMVVIPMAYFVEGERPTIHSLVGGAIAVSGVIALTLIH